MLTKAIWHSLFVVAAFGLIACNQYSDGDMIGDYQADSMCPISGCANATADSTTLALASSLSSINSNSSVLHVDFGGDCYVSTFPSNTIQVQVLSGSTVISPGVSGEQGASQAVQCHGGHFEVALDTSALASPGVYTINLNLIAMDSSGNQYTNAGSGSLTITLIH